MSELDSEGLLSMDDTPAAMAIGQPPSDTSPGAAAATTADEHAATGQAAATDAATGQAAATDPAKAAGAAAETETAAAEAGPPEQRTLGRLLQAPEWYKVLDTGSSSIYYWNTTTNEVLWDAPEGLDGDQLVPVEPEGAAANAEEPAAAAAAATAGAGEMAVDEHEVEEGKAGGSEHAAKGAVAEPVKGESTSPRRHSHAEAAEEKAVHPAAATAAAVATGAAEGVPSEPLPGTPEHPSAMQHALAAPAADVQPVFMTLMSELENTIGEQLQLVPGVIQMAIQLQLLQQQWQALAGLQQAAVAAGDAGRAVSWSVFEQYMMQQLRSMFCQLQLAMEAWQGLQQHQQGQDGQQQQQQGEQQNGQHAGEGDEQLQQGDGQQEVAGEAGDVAAAPGDTTVSYLARLTIWEAQSILAASQIVLAAVWSFLILAQSRCTLAIGLHVCLRAKVLNGPCQMPISLVGCSTIHYEKRWGREGGHSACF